MATVLEQTEPLPEVEIPLPPARSVLVLPVPRARLGSAGYYTFLAACACAACAAAAVAAFSCAYPPIPP